MKIINISAFTVSYVQVAGRDGNSSPESSRVLSAKIFTEVQSRVHIVTGKVS